MPIGEVWMRSRDCNKHEERQVKLGSELRRDLKCWVLVDAKCVVRPIENVRTADRGRLARNNRDALAKVRRERIEEVRGVGHATLRIARDRLPLGRITSG